MEVRSYNAELAIANL
jgi:hypothetical protein